MSQSKKCWPIGSCGSVLNGCWHLVAPLLDNCGVKQSSLPAVFTGIPYSEHSSFLELKRFVQWLQPLKIIPTVNVGSWNSRKAMEKCFGEWLAEAKAKL